MLSCLCGPFQVSAETGVEGEGVGEAVWSCLRSWDSGWKLRALVQSFYLAQRTHMMYPQSHGGAEPRTPDFWLSDLCIYQTQGPGQVDSTPSPSPEAFGDKNGVLWGLLAGRPSRALPASLGGLHPGPLESEGDAGCLTAAR